MNIELTQGKVTVVDDIDADLAEYKWYYHHTGYAMRGKKNWRKLLPGISKHLRLHRVIMERMGHIPEQVDHINGDGLDNRRCNLRSATSSQNQCNRGPSIGKYKGVSWHKRHKKWQASIRINSKLHFLGYFDSEEDAALAYNKAAKKLHGEFAYLNKV